ncbi:MAG: hypothetical protein D6719_06000 [Candidatus Dadabacteria bacterium]|nr:MAG: hypothetical protein D6719_06000 [Candidatus Dadabacteria bacterium]
MQEDNICSEIVVVSTTHYPEGSKTAEVRAELALNSVTELVSSGAELLLVDSGANSAFKERAVEAGAKILQQQGSTLGASRREAFSAGRDSGKKVIAYFEIEKRGFAEKLKDVCRPVLNGEAGMVIPARKTIESYPDFQQLSETLGNMYCYMICGHYFDLFFGPRIVSRETVTYFTGYQGEYGDSWEALFIPVLRALKDGVLIKSLEVDFEYPEEQLRVEANTRGFIEKRLFQLELVRKAVAAEWERLTGGS